MRLSMIRRGAVAGFGMAVTAALSFGFAGCGGTHDAGDATVVVEPGSTLPTPGAASSTAGSSASPAAKPAAASTAPAAAVKSEGWGTLKGQVVFGSSAPGVEILVEQGKAPKDPTVCAKEGPIKSERLVVDGATKGVKNVLVYLAKPTAINDDAKAAAGKLEVLFDQKNCVFEPHVLGLMVGAKINLKSSDPVNHNVNAKLPKNGLFNSLLSAGQAIVYTPTSGERSPAVVTCDIHPWMSARWLVLEHPYFAVTDEKGNFEIKNVPAGTQKVVVWEEATDFVTPSSGEDVTIAANADTSKTFTIDPAKVKPAK
jgi:plastocyanin